MMDTQYVQYRYRYHINRPLSSPPAASTDIPGLADWKRGCINYLAYPPQHRELIQKYSYVNMIIGSQDGNSSILQNN